MSLPPPRKPAGHTGYVPLSRVNKGVYTLVGKTAWLVCSKCRGQMSVAHGSVAEVLSSAVAVRTGIAQGWQMAPKVLCRFCQDERCFWLYRHDGSDCLFWSDEQLD